MLGVPPSPPVIKALKASCIVSFIFPINFPTLRTISTVNSIKSLSPNAWYNHWSNCRTRSSVPGSGNTNVGSLGSFNDNAVFIAPIEKTPPFVIPRAAFIPVIKSLTLPPFPSVGSQPLITAPTLLNVVTILPTFSTILAFKPVLFTPFASQFFIFAPTFLNVVVIFPMPLTILSFSPVLFTALAIQLFILAPTLSNATTNLFPNLPVIAAPSAVFESFLIIQPPMPTFTIRFANGFGIPVPDNNFFSASANEATTSPNFQIIPPQSILVIKSAIDCPTASQSTPSSAVIIISPIPNIVSLILFPRACQPVKPVLGSTSFIPEKNPFIPSAIFCPSSFQVSLLETRI